MNKNLLLTIGYSSLADRVKNIKFLEDVNNLVVIQNPESLLVPDLQPEVKVIKLGSRGVTKSRNAVLENTSSRYLLFGDDDITFNESGINEAISYLEAHPEIAILLMQAVDENGKLRKFYPKSAHSLKLTNSAKAATYEIMVRTESIKSAGIKFNENFGAGAKNYLGDEYIFIADALRAGLKGAFRPIVIAIHPSESSGNLRNSSEDISARSKIFTRVFGIWAVPMRFAFILRRPIKELGILNTIRFVLGK